MFKQLILSKGNCPSTVLSLYFNIILVFSIPFLDASNKMNKSIIAIMAFNEVGDAIVVSAKWLVEGSAEAQKEAIMAMLYEVCLRASEKKYIASAATDCFRQLLCKINFILSDSCSVANKVKSLLVESIKQKLDQPEKIIPTGGCSMHIGWVTN